MTAFCFCNSSPSVFFSSLRVTLILAQSFLADWPLAYAILLAILDDLPGVNAAAAAVKVIKLNYIYFCVCLGLTSISISFVLVLFSLAPHQCGFESHQGLWILSCDEVIQLAFRTSAVHLGCPLVPEIMHGGAPEVFLCCCIIKIKLNHIYICVCLGFNIFSGPILVVSPSNWLSKITNLLKLY